MIIGLKGARRSGAGADGQPLDESFAVRSHGLMSGITVAEMLATSGGNIWVICNHCRNSIVVDVSCWDPALEVPELKRFFRCSICGEKAGRTMPTWEGWWAPGIGRPEPEEEG
jgi:hypothetical protein